MALREQPPPDLEHDLEEDLDVWPHDPEVPDADAFDPFGDDDDDHREQAPAVLDVDPDIAEARLTKVIATFGGVPREAQIAMVRGVAEAITAREHLLVAAPTGTGKTLGYAIPASLAAGRLPVLLSTATKALQQQLVDADLPALARVDPHLDVAVLKGRGEYVCVSKLRQLAVNEPLFDSPIDPDAWDELVGWADETTTGDRAEAPDGVTDAEWRGISVGSRECPGKNDCPFGSECFAEYARDRAREADIVVVNHHLVLHDALADRWLLPEHEVLCLDEAHKLVDIASSVLGVAIHPKRLTDLAGQADDHVDAKHANRLRDAAGRLVAALEGLDPELPADTTAEPLSGALDDVKGAASGLRAALASAHAAAGTSTDTDASEKAEALNRLAKMASSLVDELAMLTDAHATGRVAFVEQSRSSRSLRTAPIEVDQLLSELVFSGRTVIATSATLTVGGELEPTAAQLGADQHPWRALQVPSPFDYPNNALLYVPRRAPDPRQPGYEQMALDTTRTLIEAAGGRSLLLFTSWTRLNATADWLAERLPDEIELLVQGTGPPRRLIERYVANEASVLLGVASFWEGISAEGLASVNVIVDKLPFARRGDPLTDARRQAAEDAGRNGFAAVDLPLAAITLAQGVGRLIRTVDDFGCIAVLDSRLATKGYRNTLLNSLPPARRTINLDVPDGLMLPEDPAERLTVLSKVPGGPPATAWLRTRLTQAGR
jgi:ATP-dependent DNA helicase DinG